MNSSRKTDQANEDPQALNISGRLRNSSGNREASVLAEEQEQGNKNVIFNARGLPVRQRKKNPIYYDESLMLTPTGKSMARMKERVSKNVKLGAEKEKGYPVDFEVPAGERHSHGQDKVNNEKVKMLEETNTISPSPIHLNKLVRQTNKLTGAPAPAPRRPRGSISTARPSLSTPQIQDEQPGSDHEEYEIDYVLNMTSSPTPSEPDIDVGNKNGDGPNKPRGSTTRATSKKSRPCPVRYEQTRKQQQHENEIDGCVPPEQKHQENQTNIMTNKANKRLYRRQMKMSSGNNVGIVNQNEAEEENGMNLDSVPTSILGSMTKQTACALSISLRNLLKLPKAHKWVCYEWFYSNIDKALFKGDNDFQICLKESFPQLKARQMHRLQWCQIRRIMGKPRRCSQAFFDAEREELSRRRQMIRMLQQRRNIPKEYKEVLPNEIPMQLVIGTKVTARLRQPQDGLFTGTIEGVDTSNFNYRIRFDRPGLGSHSIPDFEVLSIEPPDTVSLSNFCFNLLRPSSTSGVLKAQHAMVKSSFPENGTIGGFPVRLLEMLILLSKTLKSKREKIIKLKELNVEGEKMRSYGIVFNEDYRLRYSRCVMELESMNQEISIYLPAIQEYCIEIAPDVCANQLIIPENLQQTCRQEAAILLSALNTQMSSPLQTPKQLSLISNLGSLLLQIRALSGGGRSLYELKSIKDSMQEIKASLEGSNLELFENQIEIPMNRIIAGLTIDQNKLPLSKSKYK